MRFTIRFILPFLFASVAFGQPATVRGVITDTSGAIIPAAKVTLTDTRGSVKSAVAGADGSYAFTGVAAGSYTLQASAPDLSMEPAKLLVGSGVQTLNLELKVATVTQQVTVEERAALVTPEPANNASATVLGSDDLQALSDNPDDLIAELMAIAGPGAGPGGASLFIDGFTGGEIPSKESIREVRINQNPFAPEYDKLGTGRIEILTKPGTSQLHGSVFENFANDFWNSRNPYAQQKAPFLLKEYGGNVSGPFSKRGSAYFDVRRDSIDNGAVINGTTLDPATLAVIDPFTDVLRIRQRRWALNPRIDYQLGSSNTLVGRYTFMHMDIPAAGVGGFNLTSRGFQTTTTAHTAQLTDTAVLSERLIDEIRFQFYRSANERVANTLSPAIQVLGSFNGGGAQVGHSSDRQNSYELQNYMTLIHAAHTLRFGVRVRGETDDNVSQQNFGGTFTFGGGIAPLLDANNSPVLDSNGQPVLSPVTSIERYRRTLLFQRLGFSTSQIGLLGGGATQFSISAGNPSVSAKQFDFGAFLGDDWKVRSSLTMSLGLRYEGQTNVRDWRDFAPRLGLAWALGRGGSSRSKTVIRAGFGAFYDRFGLGNTITAIRYDGTHQQQFVLTDPDFYPMIPPVAALAAFQTTQIRQQVSPNLVAPYILQSAAGIERQLPFDTTIAVTYTNSHALHILRSRDLNSPLPGTYDPNVPGSGLFPLGATGAVFLMESSGLYNQNQLTLNVNTKARNVSLTGSYTLNRAMSNTDGIGTFPANPYSTVGEYGPAAADVRHRVNLSGTITTRWNIALSPLLVLQSGPPFDITAGSDLYGTTLFNGRPGIATNPNKLGVIQTSYGLLDPNPTPDERILHRNYGRGPGSILANLRVTKTVAFGPERSAASAVSAGSADRSVVTRPYKLTISMSARNILNHTNPGPIVGNITSPLFGRANQPSGGPGGNGGFSENANNRQLELQMRVTF